jgi:hypothetical protein
VFSALVMAGALRRGACVHAVELFSFFLHVFFFGVVAECYGKISQGLRSLGVGLSITIWWCLKAHFRNRAAKIKHTFQPRPYEQLKVLSALVQRCDARYFILNEAVRNSALALH